MQQLYKVDKIELALGTTSQQRPIKTKSTTRTWRFVRAGEATELGDVHGDVWE